MRGRAAADSGADQIPGVVVGYRRWFADRGWVPFSFQEDVWQSVAAGASGVLHAPTGTGKTLAAWLGAVARTSAIDAAGGEPASGLHVVWVTPLRALAADTVRALEEPLGRPGPVVRGWTVGLRTGDSSAADRRRLRANWPTALVTTPESLSILLSLDDAHEIFGTLDTVIVDEWHELLSTKRGVQTELALERLRSLRPEVVTWGLSATLANLGDAVEALVGPTRAADARLVSAAIPRRLEIETLIPEPMERFPWAGHMGLRLVPQVVAAIDRAATTLVFTNTRSQAERWFDAISAARPDWRKSLALHHGSVDRDLRTKAEAGLKQGRMKCVVATSSLDLGVDFGPVEQVLQVGSPKGIGRLLQRAGRSGHAPGATGRLVCVPTHALELIECAAARGAVAEGTVEARRPLELALDCLAQHIVTVACSGGFREADLLAEVRRTRAFARLDDASWRWALDFAARGGPALAAYPNYARIVERFGRWYVSSKAIARRHRMGIGTIASDATVEVKWLRGGRLGTVEESFISRLDEGDRFLFAGRPLVLFRFDGLTAWVKRSRVTAALQVPRWNGGRMPLSTLLSSAVLDLVREATKPGAGRAAPREVAAVLPLLQIQSRWSRLPDRDTLLIERWTGRDGHHAFVFPFEGRLVHEGLAALVAWRIARAKPSTLTFACTDWGFELAGPEADIAAERTWRRLLSPANLLEDLLACLNTTEMARRHFREIARVAGLVQGGGRTDRQTQASAGLIYDVLAEHDATNMLLAQARREVLEQQFEFRRLAGALEAIAVKDIRIVETPRITPLAFPIWAEFVQSRLTTKDWLARIADMARELEHEAGGPSS
ncbi:MAG: ligase-associated DNA damage response DEXH box helicase [Planctomycetes bacterium]|nr:ligase-associated DNA damage response DEXH box helicase [Planctomycetota bacterium]